MAAFPGQKCATFSHPSTLGFLNRVEVRWSWGQHSHCDSELEPGQGSNQPSGGPGSLLVVPWQDYQIPHAQCGRAWSKRQVIVVSHPHRVLVLKFKPPRTPDTMHWLLEPRRGQPEEAVSRKPERKAQDQAEGGGRERRPAPIWEAAKPAWATPPEPYMAGSGNGRSALQSDDSVLNHGSLSAKMKPNISPHRTVCPQTNTSSYDYRVTQLGRR